MEDDARVCSKKGCHQELPSAEEYSFRLCEGCRAKARVAKQKQVQRERAKTAEQRSNESATPVSTSAPFSNAGPVISALSNSSFPAIASILSNSVSYPNRHSFEPLQQTQGLVTWSTCGFWPYDNDFFVPYNLFKGLGPPPIFFGLPGDVFLDVTQGNYQLYGRTLQGWMVWAGPKETKSLVIHPHQSTRVLWCSISLSSMGWLPTTGVISDSRTASECLALVHDAKHSVPKRKVEADEFGTHSVKRVKLDISSQPDVRLLADSISTNGLKANGAVLTNSNDLSVSGSPGDIDDSVPKIRIKIPRTAPLPSTRKHRAFPKYLRQQRSTPSSSSETRQRRKQRIKDLESELAALKATQTQTESDNATLRYMLNVLNTTFSQKQLANVTPAARVSPPATACISPPAAAVELSETPTIHAPLSTSETPPEPRPLTVAPSIESISSAPRAPPSNGTSTVLECYNCHASTPFWTQDEKGRTACKECSSYYQLHGSDRPTEHNVTASSCPPVCAKCQTSESPVWREDNRGRLLCNTCGLYSKWKGPVRVTGYETASAPIPVAKKEEVDDVIMLAPLPPIVPQQRSLKIIIPPLKSKGKLSTKIKVAALPSASAPLPAEKRCYNCDAPSSRSWTKIDGKPACNRCWQYRRRKGIDRPNNISTNALRTQSCRETAAKNARARRTGGAATVPVTVPMVKQEMDPDESPVTAASVPIVKHEEPVLEVRPKSAKSSGTNRCYNCGTTHSACGRWPKIADGRRACNRCFLYWRAHGFDRPNVATQTALRIKTKEMEMHGQDEPASVEWASATANAEKPAGETRCYNCDTNYSMSGWWPKIDDGRTACNRCWLYHRRKGIHRPKNISSDDLRKQSLRETWAKQKKVKSEFVDTVLSENTAMVVDSDNIPPSIPV